MTNWEPVGDFGEHNPEEMGVRFTPEGIEQVLRMYEDVKAGMSIEDIEKKHDLDPGEPGPETHHLEFRILMAMGGLSGLFDHYDELLEMTERLDKVEDEFN